jgi:hypothetical protein
MDLRFFKFFLLFLKFFLTNEQFISFEHDYSDSFSNFFLKDGYLFTTGTNYVFRLNAKNISRHHSLFKERLINTTYFTKNKTRSKNFIKLLIWRETNHDIIICGTNLGKPHLYDLKFFDLSNQL